MEKTETPTIADLRAMVSGQAPEKPAAKPAEETPAAAAEETPAAETAPAPEPEKQGEHEEEPEPAPERGEDGKYKPSKNVQKRIDRLVREKGDVERENADLKRRLAENQGSRPATGKPENNAQPQAAAKGKPDQAKYATYEEYMEAVTDWKVEERLSAREKAERDRAAEAAQADADKAFAARLDQARRDHADFDEILSLASKLPISAEIHRAIQTRELGPELAYYLAQNGPDVERIVKLAPHDQVIELGKIEAKLEAARTPEPKPPARKALPKPPAHVGGSGGAKQQKLDDPDLSMADFKRIARASMRRD